jgi:ABC-2 type transport system permease protein
VADAVRAYFLIAFMWVRSSMAYRASFVAMTLAQFLVTGLDFVTIWIMFTHTHELGGYSLPEVAFLYSTSGLALGLADLMCGNIERLGMRVRDGSLDVMLIRPVPTLVQMAADDFALRRLGRIGQAAAVFGWSLSRLQISWTLDRIVLVPIMVLAGTAIFCGIFVLGAAFQFVATDASQAMNAFTYGGNTLTQYPPTVFARDLVRTTVFIIPIGFVNWLPALHVLGRPDPLGLPATVQFLSPLAALAICLVAGIVWRAGIRNYRSTGS